MFLDIIHRPALIWKYRPVYFFQNNVSETSSVDFTWVLGRVFSFLILYTVGLLWTGNQPVARPVPTHSNTNTE
jgi:hypothetical protein